MGALTMFLPSYDNAPWLALIVAIVVAAGLGALVALGPPVKTPEQRREEWLQRLHDDCTFMGFKPGTAEHSNCQLQLRLE
jgi:hypothetical protein